ncbi:MAG: peptide chain release factor subunit 1 [Blastocatellia bacterium]|nr:peptide chain release factor subunit 1 [Blastocatellia bacterium]
MISKNELELLKEREPKPGSPVLTVYLNTDLSLEANIDRGFKIMLKDLLRDIEQRLDMEERKEFEADAERVKHFVEYYHEPQRGLVMFVDDSEDFFQIQELRVGVRDRAWWSETPYLRPLIEIMDEHERYGLVVTDRKQARLFTIYLGEIEEQMEAFAEADVTHIKSSGMDHLRSQMNIERKADEHAHWHLKHVAELMSRLARRHDFDRLILAGTVEATSELNGLLPKALRARVVRRIVLPVEASLKVVLDETLKVEEEIERELEVRTVEDLINASGERKAVLELDRTLDAVQQRRVWQMVYRDGFEAHGTECTNCGALSALEGDTCVYCGKPVREVRDVVSRADTRVIEMRAKVECVRGAAADRLKEVGSIGALLRY